MIKDKDNNDLDIQQPTDAELRVAEFILQNQQTLPAMTITDMAHKLRMSTPTLSRVIRRLGYASIKHLKASLLDQQRITPAHKLVRNLPSQALPPLFSDTIDHLEKTMHHFDQASFDRAIEAMNRARVLYCYGKDAAHSAAYLLNFRFSRFRRPCVLMNPSGSSIFESLHGVQKEDLIVLFAFGSLPIEAKIILEHSKKAGLSCLLVTDRLSVSPQYQPEIQLYVARGDLDQYHSMSTAITMVDALLMAYAARFPATTRQDLESLYMLKEAYTNKLPR